MQLVLLMVNFIMSRSCVIIIVISQVSTSSKVYEFCLKLWAFHVFFASIMIIQDVKNETSTRNKRLVINQSRRQLSRPL